MTPSSRPACGTGQGRQVSESGTNLPVIPSAVAVASRRNMQSRSRMERLPRFINFLYVITTKSILSALNFAYLKALEPPQVLDSAWD